MDLPAGRGGNGAPLFCRGPLIQGLRPAGLCADPFPLCRRSGVGLSGVSLDDGGNQTGKAFFQLRAAGGIVHFHPAALAPDEPGLAQRLEMLGEGRFRDVLLADLEEGGAILGALGSHDPGKDGNADGIGEGMENAFDRDVLNRRMKKGPHGISIA